MTTWTAPVTFTAGSALTAAQMNAEVRDHAIFLKGALDLLTNSTTADTGATMYLSVARANTTDVAVRTLQSGDTQPRFAVAASGSHAWGPGGSTVADTTLARSGAGNLRLDNRLDIYQTAANIALSATATGDGNFRFSVLGDGTARWGDGSSAPDTNLYRESGGNALQTDDVFKVNNTSGLFTIGTGGTILRNQLVTTDANPSFRILHANGELQWGAGGASAIDVNLYRGGANILQTDDILQMPNGLQLSSAGYIIMGEISAPAVGSANTVRIFSQDNGAGKTQLMAIFSSGAAQQIAIQP